MFKSISILIGICLSVALSGCATTAKLQAADKMNALTQRLRSCIYDAEDSGRYEQLKQRTSVDVRLITPEMASYEKHATRDERLLLKQLLEEIEPCKVKAITEVASVYPTLQLYFINLDIKAKRNAQAL